MSGVRYWLFYLTFTPWLKALLTGIALVFAMADHYQLIFPMIITCLGATISAQRPGGKPLYLSLLAWALVKQQSKDDGNVAAQSATLLEGNRADT